MSVGTLVRSTSPDVPRQLLDDLLDDPLISSIPKEREGVDVPVHVRRELDRGP
jgi:hypothetical protein